MCNDMIHFQQRRIFELPSIEKIEGDIYKWPPLKDGKEVYPSLGDFIKVGDEEYMLVIKNGGTMKLQKMELYASMKLKTEVTPDGKHIVIKGLEASNLDARPI